MILYNKKIFNRLFKRTSFIKKIKHIPLYFKQINFLMKHGYDSYALWEYFDWFINIMKEILVEYRDNAEGWPSIVGSYENWKDILNQMLSLLNDMDEHNEKYDDIDLLEKDNLMQEAANKFFELFAKYFYCLWD